MVCASSERKAMPSASDQLVESNGMKSPQKPKPKPKQKQKSGHGRVLFDQLSMQKAKRSMIDAAQRTDEPRDIAFRRMILSIPPGKVSTYGRVASAAGYPRLHRAVARLLRTDPSDNLPWHRVLGAGGEIKLRGEAAGEQRARLKLEGVRFRGERVDMERFEYALKPWEVYRDLAR